MTRTPEGAISRRTLLGGKAAASVAITGARLAATPAPALAAPAGFPNYQYVRDAFASPLRYNPTGEFIFPCVRIASDNGRVAAPAFGTDGGVQYMRYEAGPRLDARICVARAVE
ncbi:hypothetical protein B0E53_00860 [Micromonospora sp. MH33]|uniref:hypothetical protein n=1 Tax=Micromonospora sp. MH33 TaxID=1945509 RepID=UPI000D14B712|nr:hypothetical protein [Micromonospora sp. MH33]PSK67132.1 hypothetical protein B0E53_00860 [Micromonospora sp. MH33]